MTDHLRLRVFAGPNGSGKSTIIEAIKKDQSTGRPINFGIYINADDIAKELLYEKFDLGNYHIKYDENDLHSFAATSGLITPDFTMDQFLSSFSVTGNKIRMNNADPAMHAAQLFARYLREMMLEQKVTFSFETVFSHESNIEFMEKAVAAGYKVYFYFVSTESPLINKYRVDLRVKQKGHFVPEDKIEDRYYRSLQLMYKAAQISYQAYFFDNSGNDAPFRVAAHFKMISNKKNWDPINPEEIPQWFKKYYLDKVTPA